MIFNLFGSDFRAGAWRVGVLPSSRPGRLYIYRPLVVGSTPLKYIEISAGARELKLDVSSRACRVLPLCKNATHFILLELTGRRDVDHPNKMLGIARDTVLRDKS